MKSENNQNCPYCDATVIMSRVMHEPDCPTWDMYCEENTQSPEV